MDIRDIILFTTAAFNVTLSSVIIFHNPRSRINIFYSLAALSAALWALGVAFFRIADFPLALAIARFYYVAAALIAVFFLQFALVFPEGLRTSWSRMRYAALYLPLPFIALLLFTDAYFVSYAQTLHGKDVRLGPAYLSYVLYFVGYVGAAFWILFNKFRKASAVARAQLWFVLTGVGIAMAFGMWFNLFLPITNYRFIWAGPPFTIVMVSFIGYAILKHSLYNVKVIATEAFGIGLALVLFVRLFTSASATDVILNALILVIAASIAVLLIRSVLKEVEQREKIQTLATELATANTELKRLDAAKSEFISIAGHQLRAPLTFIKGYVSMFLEGTLGPVSDFARESMKKVFVSTEQLVRLVGDLLDLSRIEAGRMRYQMTRVVLADLAREVVRQFEATARAKGLILLFQNRDAGELAVNGDPDKLREVVTNLVDNAIKYTASGRVVVELYAQERAGRRWLTLKVQDSGIGIKTADLAKMFTKFTRTEEARRLRPDGMGLGLYIVKKIIDDHGGEVTVASPGLGRGSAFSVMLPAL